MSSPVRNTTSAMNRQRTINSCWLIRGTAPNLYPAPPSSPERRSRLQRRPPRRYPHPQNLARAYDKPCGRLRGRDEECGNQDQTCDANEPFSIISTEQKPDHKQDNEGLSEGSPVHYCLSSSSSARKLMQHAAWWRWFSPVSGSFFSPRNHAHICRMAAEK